MLKIRVKYRAENNIIFNSKKTVCIKFGSTIIEGESAFVLYYNCHLTPIHGYWGQ